MEPLGTKLRRRRRRLGFTLDELAGKTCISKPYLSLIETERVPNPPSDEKLRRLEQTLEFTPGELISQAHLQRTPRDVRAMLQKLIEGRGSVEATKGPSAEGKTAAIAATQRVAREVQLKGDRSRPVGPSLPAPINLDDAYLSGVLQE